MHDNRDKLPTISISRYRQAATSGTSPASFTANAASIGSKKFISIFTVFAMPRWYYIVDITGISANDFTKFLIIKRIIS